MWMDIGWKLLHDLRSIDGSAQEQLEGMTRVKSVLINLGLAPPQL